MLSRWKQNSLFLFVLFEVHMSDMTQTFFNIYPYESPDLSMLRGFDNKCLRRILQIYWPNVISNNDLEDCTGGWGGGAPKFLGRGCSSYLLRVKIQGFGTAWGAIDEILAFLHTVHTNRDIKSRIGSSS